jgi:hypothetical protein
MRRLTVLDALDRLHHEYRRAKRRKSGVPPEVPKARQGLWLGWLVLLAGIAGCAAIRVDSPPEEKTKYIAQRAEARWQLLIKGDVAGAYEYLSAGSKATTPVDVYKGKIHPGMWREAKVEQVECEKEVCKVQLQITYDAKRMKGIQTPVFETWIIENGTAGYVYR